MGNTLSENQTLSELAELLYNFLPGSGNASFSYPVAAQRHNLGDYWIGGSKGPAILSLIERTFESKRQSFCPLILSIVKLSIPWRMRKSDPLSVREIDSLNQLLLRLQFKIPDLYDPVFRRNLAGSVQPPTPVQAAKPQPNLELSKSILSIASLPPGPRGFAFEKVLAELFCSFGLAPRGSFRLVGEQIDGSLSLDGDTYLLEAKWQSPLTDNRDLQAFAGSVSAKSAWTRGLFISYSGFSEDGLSAFARGNSTRIICMDGRELWEIADRGLDLRAVLHTKTRKAAETGQAFVRLD